MSAPISVLVAEDHVVVREGICALLNTDGGFHIVGVARTGREVVALAQSLRPDVILMDIAMPELNGLEATRRILSDAPAAKVLILSAYSDEAYVDRATQSGASGFLEKQTSTEVLARAIRTVASGGVFYSPAIVKRRAVRDGSPTKPKKSDLTSRESEVLQLVAEGATNKQIAFDLAIGIKTVEKHRQHLMNKLHIHNTAGLTRYAIARGVIESSVQVTVT